MAAKKKPDEKTLRVREVEANARVTAAKIEGIARVVTSVIKYGFFSYCAWATVQAVQALAGHNTMANITMQFIGKLSTSSAVSYTVAAGSLGWGYAERRLRTSKTETLQNRNRRLESMIDLKRSSSHLTPTGETNPLDEEP